MTYQTSMTRKGQITIPKPLRDLLGLNISSNIILNPVKNKAEIVIKTHPDIIDLAGSLKLKKKATSVLKAREAFEKHYRRI